MSCQQQQRQGSRHSGGGLLSTNQSSGRRGSVRRDEMHVVEWEFRVPISRPGKSGCCLSCLDERGGKSAQPRIHPGFVIGGCPEQWPKNQQPLLAELLSLLPLTLNQSTLEFISNFRFPLKGFH